MRWRQIGVLWLLAGALAVQHFMIDRRKPVAPAAERPVRPRLLAAVSPAEVTAVRFERGPETVALRRYAGEWVVEQPPGGQVPAGLVQAFLEAVTAVEQIERVGGAGGPETMGLGAAALRVHVTDAAGGEHRLSVGDTNAAGTAVYARLNDEAGAVLIGRNLVYYAQLIMQEAYRLATPAPDGPVA